LLDKGIHDVDALSRSSNKRKNRNSEPPPHTPSDVVMCKCSKNHS